MIAVKIAACVLLLIALIASGVAICIGMSLMCVASVIDDDED